MEEFEWDEEKAASNLVKHGIDFQGAIHIFEGPLLVTRSDRRSERRWQAIGVAGGLELAVIYTWREGRRRIISARRADIMSEKRTVRRTQADRNKDRTDWERLRNMTEEEIERGAQSDPDNPPWSEEELAAAELLMPSDEPKIPLSIRLDPEIIEFFRKEGSGYQSRINAVLLGYVRSRKWRP